MKQSEIIRALRTPNPEEAMQLFRYADTVRRANVGEAVQLVGSIEIFKFRMTAAQLTACAMKAAAACCTGLILQAADDEELNTAWVSDLIRQIKNKTKLEITLSLGERPENQLSNWQNTGADRYLLRSAPGRTASRLKFLKKLESIGYAVATEMLVGAPRQSYESLASDIQMFADLDPDLVSVGPYLPRTKGPIKDGSHLPATADLVYRVLALTRRLCPRSHILTTPALDILNTINGFELGLGRGGNMVVVNVAPKRLRKLYDVDPEPPGRTVESVRERLRGIGRRVAIAPGRPSATRFL